MKKLKYRKRGVTFVWEGGEYIDMVSGGQSVAVNNVWVIENGEGRSSIPFERDAFEAECDEWLAGMCPEEIAEYGVTDR